MSAPAARPDSDPPGQSADAPAASEVEPPLVPAEPAAPGGAEQPDDAVEPDASAPAAPAPMVASTLTVTVGAPAHGGSCVAHAPDGRVVFVRHALPGETVVAQVTANRKAWLRADAIEVLSASPDRVSPPCPWAGPGRCGGCDLQHVAPAAQRDWKAGIVVEQLQRLAGITWPVTVEALPEPVGAEGEGLGWRTRVAYSVGGDGRAGLLAHHSHTVIPVDRCRIAHEQVQAAGVLERRWPRMASVDVAVGGGRRRITARPARGRPRVEGPEALRERAAGRDFVAHGFWQVHPAAADTLVSAVLEMLVPVAGERALDLFAGAGLFAAALADVGASVIAVEGSATAARDAVVNTAALPVEVRHGQVDEALTAGVGSTDLVVLDPPRDGARAAVVTAIAALAPRAVAYVACDPAPLARDLAVFATHGYALTALRAFDCFPMTHHVECVALLTPVG